MDRKLADTRMLFSNDMRMPKIIGRLHPSNFSVTPLLTHSDSVHVRLELHARWFSFILKQTLRDWRKTNRVMSMMNMVSIWKQVTIYRPHYCAIFLEDRFIYNKGIPALQRNCCRVQDKFTNVMQMYTKVAIDLVCKLFMNIYVVYLEDDSQYSSQILQFAMQDYSV